MDRPAEAPPPPVSVNVHVGQGRPRADVVEDLRAAGLHVERVLGSIGVVCGTVLPNGLDALAHVDGVTSVEPDREVSAFPRR